MIDTPITFEKIPEALALILQRIEAVERKMDTMMSACFQQQSQDRWMNIDELCEYLPQHSAKQTVYGWTSSNLIPHNKSGCSVIFLKSKIDEWLLNGKVKSIDELAAEAEAFAQKKKGEPRARCEMRL